jgi:hypothetical protein
MGDIFLPSVTVTAGSSASLGSRIIVVVLQALDCLREHYHPTMLNNPDGIVWAKLEFNMTGVKKDR